MPCDLPVFQAFRLGYFISISPFRIEFMQVAFHSQIDDFKAEEWNRLVKDENPFLRYEFLSALEHND
ncbi:MAG: GNAT family N-acetyltransferase, partial [Candidatus Thiodiazotropha sp. (ex. Lucinisca nassula)]|nr:GNAT family N-acetyltransferase [Candidatus Thiodiazotropha sp. (ex. Lucinisca nassula)]